MEKNSDTTKNTKPTIEEEKESWAAFKDAIFQKYSLLLEQQCTPCYSYESFCDTIDRNMSFIDKRGNFHQCGLSFSWDASKKLVGQFAVFKLKNLENVIFIFQPCYKKLMHFRQSLEKYLEQNIEYICIIIDSTDPLQKYLTVTFNATPINYYYELFPSSRTRHELEGNFIWDPSWKKFLISRHAILMDKELSKISS